MISISDCYRKRHPLTVEVNSEHRMVKWGVTWLQKEVTSILGLWEAFRWF